MWDDKITRAYACTRVRLQPLLIPILTVFALIYSRRRHSTSPFAARSKLILLISSPARLQLRLSYCRPIRATTAARPRDLSHFRLADEMAQQQRWHARDSRGYYNGPWRFTDISILSVPRRTRKVRNKNGRTRKRKKALCAARAG